MTATARLLLAALLLGIAGDYLLRGMPYGINVAVGVVLFLAALVFVVRQPRSMAFGAAGALAAAVGIACRDAEPLFALDFLVLLIFLGFLSLPARGVRVTDTGTVRVAAALLFTVVLSAAGVFQLFFQDIEWRSLRPATPLRRLLVVLRGFLIAFPLLLIFTLLLTSADAAFAALVADVFHIDIPRIAGHVALTSIVALVAAGVFRSLLHPRPLPEVSRPSFLRLGSAETNVAIGLIDTLFAAFVVVQFRYFFGGAALVKVAPGLTYADYARRGFFELVAVAAIVVLLLLVAEWLIDKNDRAFRLLALLQVLLVFVMLVSAWRRMQLYVDEFGLTELRVYTTAFMIWLAALLAWFALTVLRGRRQRFFAGAVISAFVIVAALHVVNPDALIVRTNLARAAAGKRTLDVKYLTSLSSDAAPALAAAHLPPPRRRPQGDWRSWNLSRASR